MLCNQTSSFFGIYLSFQLVKSLQLPPENFILHLFLKGIYHLATIALNDLVDLGQ